jgi:hypothetical protein
VGGMATKFKIRRQTLADHWKAGDASVPRHGRPTVITAEIESALVHWITRMSQLGWRLRRRHIMAKVCDCRSFS